MHCLNFGVRVFRPHSNSHKYLRQTYDFPRVASRSVYYDGVVRAAPAYQGPSNDGPCPWAAPATFSLYLVLLSYQILYFELILAKLFLYNHTRILKLECPCYLS